MNKYELGLSGKTLAKELELVSSDYHVKSSNHEVLSWVAVGVRGMATQLCKDEKCTYEISESTLLKDWGSDLMQVLPELSKRVIAFRNQYNEVKNT